MFNAKAWRRLREAAIRDRREDRFWEDIEGDLTEGKYTDAEFSIQAIWDEFVEDGREARDSWSPRHGGGSTGVRLVEAGVDTGAFANITGQIVFSRMMEEFENPVFIGGRLATTIPTQFEQEKIPGITALGDAVEGISENEAYPMAGVSEKWIETPRTTKRGVIVPVNKEAIFFDRTGQVLNEARAVSQSLAINKEKRIIDVATGQTTTYRRNGSAAITTYGDNSGTHDWDNLAASNDLIDWTDIDNALLLFDGLTDPDTGEPIVVMPNQIVVPTGRLAAARRVINATEIRFGDGASSTTQTIGANPVAGIAEILSNAYVKARTSSDSTWFIGNFMQAFAYMENWGPTTVQAPVNSEMEFTHDIVARYKISERGVPAVIEPRKVVKCTA